MERNLGKAKVYFEKLSQINLSRDFSRELGKSWKNGDGSYAVLDRKTGDILITKDLSRAASRLK